MRSLSLLNCLHEFEDDLTQLESELAQKGGKRMRVKSISNLQHLRCDDDENTFFWADDADNSTGFSEGSTTIRESSFLPGYALPREHADKKFPIEDTPRHIHECKKASVETVEPRQVHAASSKIDAQKVIELLAFLVSDTAESSCAPNEEEGVVSPKSMSELRHRYRNMIHKRQELDNVSTTQPPEGKEAAEPMSSSRRSIFNLSVYTSNDKPRVKCGNKLSEKLLMPRIDRTTLSDRSHGTISTLTPTGSPKLPRKPSLKQFPLNHSFRSDTDSTATMMKRTVSFGNLETREFSVALSDHPAVSFGPAVQLGWDYHDCQAVPVDDYEGQRAPRRSMQQLVLSYNVRRYLLLKRAHYSKAEIRQAMSESERVKRERLVTDLLLPAMKIDETLEDLRVRIKTLFWPSQAPPPAGDGTTHNHDRRAQ